ncbi:hypothetical protein L1889_07175 [Paenalcaligenes niemegkensis]|uniref:hypothetical protein n=1 Tax=Paenalcaligenes niemegkensis TaxID=2895469 RepID=UPI001EE7BE47|nr:hypothetical protein [Paenalcaligenes niemegkensis]MCQ9616517.1 hypothetical protein [Paenalcaligenes niemegkensis]
MKVLLKISAAALLAAGLAGCQHTAPSRSPEPVDPPPPVLGSQSAPTTNAAAAGATAQQQSAPVITLHLAQENAEDSLIAIDVGGASLYALPQPVLIQTDMGRVSPVTAPDQRTFIMLEMNEQGIPKLHSITEQAQGHYLLLSVQGQLVSVAQIGETIRDGRLLVSTQNQQHTQAIINMMKGSN